MFFYGGEDGILFLLSKGPPDLSPKNFRFTAQFLEPRVRITFYCTKKTSTKVLAFFMAERMGFEPMWLLAKRFSRPPRYDRFDTSPYLLEYIIIRIFRCQDFFTKNQLCIAQLILVLLISKSARV